MDGAVGHVSEEPSPVIATTAKDVSGNLRRSLEQRIGSGSSSRRALLATSQFLTATRRKNLHRRAEERGFKLINIHDQLWFAEKLCRDSFWRRELLGLTGDPPALSAIPYSMGTSAGRELIGRNGDRDKLLSIHGDRLLVGQPGSGKTFLLSKLAMTGDLLFVVSDDRQGIANEIREAESVPMLVVDDAHNESQLSLLRDLLQIRSDIGAEFEIIATSWPGNAAVQVGEVLGIPNEQVVKLEQLTIDDIVKVLSDTGIAGPRWLVAELVQQAEGRPGLAATLATACRFGEWPDVASGRRLEKYVLGHIGRASSEQARAVLASLAIGGDAGMPMSAVAEALSLPYIEVRETISTLEFSGVIRRVGENLSIRPAQLRHGLVRDTFYCGPTSLPLDPLLARTPSIADTAQVLIGAAARGASIEDDVLRALVRASDSDSVYEAYAWLGAPETQWVLQTAPGRVLMLADAALHRAPDLAIPLLLEKAIGDDRELHSTPSHPLRLIQDWVGEALPLKGEAVARRRTLLASLREWAASGGDYHVCLRALPSVLSPRFGRYFPEPSSELRGTYQFGFLSLDEVAELRELWSDVLELLERTPSLDWNIVLELLGAWAQPLSMRGELSDEVRTLLQEHGRGILRDVVPLALGRPAIIQKLRAIAQYLGVEVDFQVDHDFEILFPERSREDNANWKDTDNREAMSVRELAQDLCRSGSEDATERLSLAEKEASLLDRKWPRWTPYVTGVIAEHTDDPLAWLQCARAVGLPQDVAAPFLWRAADLAADGWASVVRDLIDDSAYREMALSFCLQRNDTPESVLEEALCRLEGHSKLVELIVFRGGIPVPLVRRLLGHSDREVALAAAQGEWASDPKGQVRDGLQSAWEATVEQHARDEYWVSEALRCNRDLAFRWLVRLLEGEPRHLWKLEEQIQAAIEALTSEQKLSLMERLPATYSVSDLVDALVNNDMNLYEVLLTTPSLELFHLIPLGRKPDLAWREKATLALQHGYPPDRIARATFHLGKGRSWCGKESNMWQEWVDAFTVFCSDPDEGIREVAETGKAYATAEFDRAREQERRESIYGIQ
ncbi:hypothetical protein KAU37_03430 [Candidatus Bipolaricaulota bacterium]|nr:hypothetical protein [Candidatus Bipolaricaulota bacterium]